MKRFLLLSVMTLALTFGVNAADDKNSKPAGPPSTPVAEMPAGIYEVDPVHVSVHWYVSHIGLMDYVGAFDKIRGKLNFNPKDPLASKVEITVYPESLRTNFSANKMDAFERYHKRDWDEELRGEKWFNVKEHPEIKFVSTKIEKTGENTGILYGDLTLLGVTKPIKLDAKFKGSIIEHPVDKIPVLGFSAKGKIKRSDFGFNAFIPIVGDEVDLIIGAEFLKKDMK